MNDGLVAAITAIVKESPEDDEEENQLPKNALVKPEHPEDEYKLPPDIALMGYTHLDPKMLDGVLHGCQGFISHTLARVRDGSLPKGLNEYLAQLPRLGQLQTRIGSKCLVTNDYKQPPRLTTAPDCLRNPQEEMSQVATWTFNVLYYFPFIWFNGSYYPRSYI